MLSNSIGRYPFVTQIFHSCHRLCELECAAFWYVDESYRFTSLQCEADLARIREVFLVGDSVSVFVILVISTGSIYRISIFPCVWLSVRSEQLTCDCELSIREDLCFAVYIVNDLLYVDTGFYTVNSCQ